MVIAVAVPSIGPFIGLIGAFCFSLLGIIAPVIIEFATYWDNVTIWMTVRNVVLIAVGLLALVFGTASSVTEIFSTYLNEPTLAISGTNATSLLLPVAAQ